MSLVLDMLSGKDNVDYPSGKVQDAVQFVAWSKVKRA